MQVFFLFGTISATISDAFTSLVSLFSLLVALKRKVARQVAFILMASKVLSLKSPMLARTQAKLCNNSEETEEVYFLHRYRPIKLHKLNNMLTEARIYFLKFRD